MGRFEINNIHCDLVAKYTIALKFEVFFFFSFRLHRLNNIYNINEIIMTFRKIMKHLSSFLQITGRVVMIHLARDSRILGINMSERNAYALHSITFM